MSFNPYSLSPDNEIIVYWSEKDLLVEKVQADGAVCFFLFASTSDELFIYFDLWSRRICSVTGLLPANAAIIVLFVVILLILIMCCNRSMFSVYQFNCLFKQPFMGTI